MRRERRGRTGGVSLVVTPYLERDVDVKVVNKPNKGRNGAVYIGRGGRGTPGSPLANPRRLGDPKPGGGAWERTETIVLYERDIRAVLDPAVREAGWWDGRCGAYVVLAPAKRAEIQAEVARLRALARVGTLELDCFCSPQACHGDVIRRIVLETPPA
jgi:hypothetical protein